MRKVAFLLVITIISISCSNTKIKEPEQIGKQVFEILKKMNTDNKQLYINNFITIEEIRELAKKEKVITDESTRNEMSSIRKEEWLEEIEWSYNAIKKEAIEYGISWQNIEYLDFVYEIDTSDGMKICEGELFIKYNNNIYKFETISIFDGNEYKLIEIDGVYKR